MLQLVNFDLHITPYMGETTIEKKTALVDADGYIETVAILRKTYGREDPYGTNISVWGEEILPVLTKEVLKK